MFEGPPLPAPDPARGVFETLLVRTGEPVALGPHLERLGRSLRALYGAALPPGAEEKAVTAARDLTLGRLRLTAAPGGRGMRLEVDAGEVDPTLVFPASGVRLASHPCPGGLGPHKLADRPTAIEHPRADSPGALLVDSGAVLEAGWANVFAVRAGTLFTPPLDNRILPGTTRAALLAIAAEEAIETREHPLSPSDLLTADETFLTGSIRGIEPALELDGEPLAGCGPVSYRLGAALRRSWGLPDVLNVPQAASAVPKLGQLSR
jgi:para-aminobenzoate synthetase/4-amino-4-deoxychorismate lyase